MPRAAEFHTTNGILRYIIKCPGCKSSHIFTTGFENEAAREDYIKRRKALGPDYQECPIWAFNGNLERPTFTPSYLLSWGGYTLPATEHAPEHKVKKHVCHSYVTDGKIRFLNDCTHALKGQTVDLPEVEV